jgi:AAHS family 4-hydroxybenzoate transporter-like MFS transporter
MCFCCTLLDGFNLTVVGVAAPKIAEYLHVRPAALGLAMSAGQLGPLFGAALLGMLADRIGRKRMLVACAFGFGLFTMLCSFATSAAQLALLLFLAGLGLGGAVPTAIALGTEYSPARSRASLSTAIYAGTPAGAIVSGLSAIYLLPHYGWQSLFAMGGGLSIIVAAMLAALVPDSMNFLIRRSDGQARVRTILAKVAPVIAGDGAVEFYSADTKRSGVPVKHLFSEGRTATTVLLWACFFLGYYLIYLMLTWAPTLLKGSGATIRQYSLAFALINFGSAAATFVVGRVMDKARSPYRVLQGGFVLGAMSLAFFGLVARSPFAVIASASIICGLFINGTVSGLVALVTLSYPTDITGSAVGWAYAIGRSGAVTAPLMGGIFVGLGWPVLKICAGNAVWGLVISGLVAVLAAYTARAHRRADMDADETVMEAS